MRKVHYNDGSQNNDTVTNRGDFMLLQSQHICLQCVTCLPTTETTVHTMYLCMSTILKVSVAMELKWTIS